ncbi:MAG TPA: RNA polymerase sigma factor [Polyangiales bacterium]|nr:RNA polymerase sigma factor [Polyangiales bacterium]
MEDAEFRELFEAHLAFVWRVLRRHGIPERDLDDACQEVFLVVYRRRSDFEGRSKLQTWIYGIAVRVALAARRRLRRAEQRVEASEPVLETDPFAHALQQQALRELESALEQVSVAQREVFVLYELEGLSLAEAAEALQVPENTALYRLYAAREAIGAHMRRRELTVQARHSQKRLKGVAR